MRERPDDTWATDLNAVPIPSVTHRKMRETSAPLQALHLQWFCWGEFSVITATYEVPWSDHLAKRAESIAVGMTIGAWDDVHPLRQKEMQSFRGEVGSITRISAEVGRFVIHYPVKNIQPTMGSLLTVVFGKVSLDGTIRLVALDLPEEFTHHFPGPALGLPGLRAKFAVYHRPFVMSIFKRENGIRLDEFTEAFEQQLAGGVDWIKDDEIFFHDDHAPLFERIPIARRLLDQRLDRTGQRGLYAPNLVGTPKQILDKARRAVELGAEGFLVSPFVVGLDVLMDLRKQGVEVPLIAHPAFVGGMIAPHGYGIAPDILLGQLPRLAGADIVLFPSPYGSVGMDRDLALAVHQHHVEPSPFPEVVSGPSTGIHAGLISQLIEDFGYDIVVNAGSAIHGHPRGTEAGARVLMDTVQEVCHGTGV